MRLICTVQAVTKWWRADRALGRLHGETDQTPRWYAANRRVAEAEANPHLPQRFLDPNERRPA